VARDRAARLARRLRLPGDADTWAAEARQLTDRILNDAWDEQAVALTEHMGPGDGLDASLLTLPLRRVLRSGGARGPVRVPGRAFGSLLTELTRRLSRG
jgi:GH15 family glucan-1,4-alpha-glucosidase